MGVLDYIDTETWEVEGVRGVMDFLAEEPSGGAGTGSPGLKWETGGWLPQLSAQEDWPQ